MKNEFPDFLKIEPARERLEIELERSKRYRTPVSCLIVEIENLDAIGAEYGQAVSVLLVAAVQRCLRAETRVVDTPAWYGSGRFFVILPVTSRSGASVASNRILKKVRSIRIPAGASAVRPEIRIGKAVFPGPDVADCATLLERAEEDLRAPCQVY
jgi:diguanylate cyclase (GGDEF)-like protein